MINNALIIDISDKRSKHHISLGRKIFLLIWPAMLIYAGTWHKVLPIGVQIPAWILQIFRELLLWFWIRHLHDDWRHPRQFEWKLLLHTYWGYTDPQVAIHWVLWKAKNSFSSQWQRWKWLSRFWPTSWIWKCCWQQEDVRRTECIFCLGWFWLQVNRWPGRAVVYLLRLFQLL